MDAEDARIHLLTGDHRQRLAAARALLGSTTTADRHLIQTAARREDDQYVRSALLRLLVSMPADTPTRVANKTDAPTDSEPTAAVIRRLTSLLTHELATIIGTLDHYAEREIIPYVTSETRREIERLRAVLASIRQFGDAAAEPAWDNFDLSQFVGEVVQDERIVHDYPQLIPHGESDVWVDAARGHLSIFLRNAIANAVEATREVSELDDRPITVTWGSDDREHWLAVLDDGPGVSGSSETWFEIGASTKDGHSGLGLSAAVQAAESLAGKLTLEAQPAGGSLCRLAWRRRTETT